MYYNAEKSKISTEINLLSIKQEEEEEEEPSPGEQEQDDQTHSDEEMNAGTIEEQTDTTKSKRGRLNASAVKNSPAKPISKAIKSEMIEGANDETVGTSRSVRLKSLNSEKETNLNLYLEDFFDIICSFQDATQRYLAYVFYELPSAKVKLVYFRLK